MADERVADSQDEHALREKGTVEWHIRRVERYLWWLGVILFVALLGVGFPWLLMSDGIGKRSRPAFFCVLSIHGLIVAWAAAKACIELLGPLLPSVDAFGQPISAAGWPARVVGFGLWMGIVAVFAWPVLQLLRPELRATFYESGPDA